VSSLTAIDRQATEGGALGVRVLKRYHTEGDSCFELRTEFEILPGITILLGHSGAGKTTLLHSIAGLSNPEQGRITIGRKVVFDSAQKINLEPARRKVAFVFQDLALFPHLTVEENVGYGLRRFDAVDREQRIAAVLESFQIAHLRKRLPRGISGGEQQRVALARSLVTEPSVLLLDEPLSSLDIQTKGLIIDDLRKWNDVRRIPMLYVTHNHEEVFALGERVIALEKGRIVADGAPLDVMPLARRETMAQFTSFENLFDAIVTGTNQQQETMTCRLVGTPVELEVPLTRVPLGKKVRLGIRASEIIFASMRPELLSTCNVLHGQLRALNPIGATIEARVDCGVEFRVRLRRGLLESSIRSSSEAWMIIRTHSCHLIHNEQLGPLQRLFVFVCSGNTSRSPMAQAICNAEIARRLKIPYEELRARGMLTLSAGLSATPGRPMTPDAWNVLREIGVPVPEHQARNLDAQMANDAEAIFCMTQEQQQLAMAMFPEASSKIYRLRANQDIDDPSGKGKWEFLNLAKVLQHSIHECLGGLGIVDAQN
jgi:molybdate transport system ATP-binding protein